LNNMSNSKNCKSTHMSSPRMPPWLFLYKLYKNFTPSL
jgi:hypothetical protein